MADASGGLQDAFQSASRAAFELGKEAPEAAKEVRALADAMKDGKITTDFFRESIAAISAKMKFLESDSEALRRANAQLTASIAATDTAVKNANFSKFAGSVTTMTNVMVSAIDSISAVASSSTGAELASSASKTAANLGNLAMAAGGVGMLIMPEFGIPLLLAGAALKLFTSASDGTIAVVDKAAKAQANMVSTLIQSGVAISGHTGEIRDAAQSAAELSMNLGITKEKAGSIGVALSDMGVRVVDTSESMSNLKAVSDGYGKQVETVTVMSRSMGVSLETATGVVGIFSARAGLSGDQVSEASGKMAVAQKMAGVQAGSMLKNFSSLADSSRQYGTDIDLLAAQTATFAKELNKGTLSISDVIALTNVQAQSMENQAGIADHIMQTDAKLAAEMGLVQGDSMGNIIRLGQNADKASGSILKWAREIGAGAGGSVENQAATMNAFLKTFGKSISDANLTMDIFTGKRGDLDGVLEKVKKSSPEEEFKNLKKSATAVLTDLGPATDRLNTVAARQLTAADSLARSSGMLEAALIEAKVAAGASLLATTASPIEKMVSAYHGVTGRGSEGYITREQQAGASRGELLKKSSGGGTTNIHLGDIKIDLGTSGGGSDGDREKIKHEVSKHVLRQLDDQWKQSHLAQ